MRYLCFKCCLITLAFAGAAKSCFGADGLEAAPRFETYAGADYDGRAASITSTFIWSYLGPLDQPGLRIKVDGLADVYGESNANVFSSNFLAANLKGLGDVMTGVQFNIANVWIKFYGGMAYEAQTRVFWQVGQVLPLRTWGAAAAVECFWRVSDRIWTSSAMSWLQPDSSGSLYSRTAYEIYRDQDLRLSLGAETGLTLGNADLYREGKALNQYNTYARGGALINLRYGLHDFSLSAGFSQESDEASPRPYATMRYGRQF